MKTTLIIGYGNIDRQDDGAAWNILSILAKRLGRSIAQDYEDAYCPCGENPDLMFVLQLTPELAETISAYERVCFIDAHTGSIPQDFLMVSVAPAFESSPLTHHLSPASLLSMTETVYQQVPEAMLVSVRGVSFQFSRQLSPLTQELVLQAAEKIWDWINA